MNSSTDPHVTDSTPVRINHVNMVSPATVAIKQTIHFLVACGEGAFGGLAAYRIVRLVIKSGLTGMDGRTLDARSYVFRGVACLAVLKGASLIYDTCVYAVGKRDLYESLPNPEEATVFNHVRHRAWKVIGGAERFFSHPVIKRVGKIAVNCTISALVGYMIYGFVRLIDKSELVKGLNSSLLRSRTYILTGLVLVTGYETLKLITNVVDYFLKQRDFYEKLEDFKHATALDRLGHRVWKVISVVENVLNRPIIKRINEIIGALIRGAFGGYIGYWFVRLLDSQDMIENPTGIVVQPLPYVLVGVISETIIETARLTYTAALAVIGSREVYETIINSEKVGIIDRLRQQTWQVIRHVENFQNDIDIIFSHALNVRTAKEIRASYLSDYKLFDHSGTYQAIVEIARRAFADQVAETFKFVVPQEIGMQAIVAFGYPILGAHAVVWLHVFGFAVGVLGKCQNVFKDMEKEKEQEQEELELTRTYCHLLELMSTNLDSDVLNKFTLMMDTKDAQIGMESLIDPVLNENQIDIVLDKKEKIEKLKPKDNHPEDKLLEILMKEPALCVLQDQQTDLVDNPILAYHHSIFRSAYKKD